MIHDTQSAQISQKQEEHDIYVIMKTMCLPGYFRIGINFLSSGGGFKHGPFSKITLM